jgi:hypothetical protein
MMGQVEQFRARQVRPNTLVRVISILLAGAVIVVSIMILITIAMWLVGSQGAAF